MREVEAALQLVDEVGEIAGEVGRRAVRLDDRAILVVAELARAQPCRALLLEQVPGRARPLERALHSTRAVQIDLVRVDVHLHAKARQRSANRREHELDTGPPEVLGGRVGRKPGLLRERDQRLALVAVLRHGLATRASA